MNRRQRSIGFMVARVIAGVAAQRVPRPVRDRFRSEWMGELDAQDRDEGGWAAIHSAAGAFADARALRRLDRLGRRRRLMTWLHGWGRDLRIAGRALRRAPGFAAVAILTLAVGIGGSAAIFNIVDRVVLR